MLTHFVSGCFDGSSLYGGRLHPGHEFILNAAKYWDHNEPVFLVVGLNDDEYIRRRKRREPVDTIDQRLTNVLQFANRVEMIFDDTPIEIIRQVKPDRIFVGDDYKIEDVAGYGEFPIEILPRYKNFSTTRLRMLAK